MAEFFRRLWYLLNRRRFERELAHDLDVHRELAARAGAPAPFGDTLRLREDAREAWGWTWIDRLLQDLRYGTRMVRKAPGFAAVAILMLAIGIGVNVAAFGFFNLAFLRVLPVRDPDTILRFQRRGPEGYSTEVAFPALTFYRDHNRTLSAVLAVNFGRLMLDGDARPVRAQFVTANYFSELGGRTLFGRGLDPRIDDAANAAPSIVLGYGFWQRQFGDDPLILGKTLRLNGKPATVVGVASPQFSGLHADQPDAWLAIAQQPYFVTGSQLLTDVTGDHGGVNMWGRLRPGVTPAMAEADLESLAAQLRQQQPKAAWEHERLVGQPGATGVGTRAGSSKGSGEMPDGRSEAVTAATLVGLLALLILIATCGNLGSLLLARGLAREREMSIRTAVGAGSGRLIRQLFTESLVLALLGAVAGLGLGYALLRSLMAWLEAPPWMDVTPDWRVASFAVAVGCVAAVLFGLAPAFQIARRRPQASRTRQILIGTQVAASCVLLVVAGLLTRAVNHVMFTAPGFDYEHVVSMSPGLGAHSYTASQARTWLDTVQTRVSQLPGVQSVALAFVSPLGNAKMITDTEIGGHQLAMYVNRITPAYFATMQIPILRGRALTTGDTRAVVISASAAARAWPGENPIGKMMQLGQDDAGKPLNFEVVGIAGNARVAALEDPDAVEIYFPVDPSDWPGLSIVVRSAAPPETLAPMLTTIARSLDPEVFPEVQILKTAFNRKLQDAGRSALAVSLLGLSALLLACLGIAGLVAYAVSQRVKEIGIRLALGAARGHILVLVLRQFSRPVIAGLIAGIAGAAGLSQILRRQLYGISALDPQAYLAAIAIFVLTVATAALWPARRALRIDPLRALRHD